jgi:hypothetical protein
MDEQSQDLVYIKKFRSISWMHLHGSAKPIHKLDTHAKKVHLISYISNHIYHVWDPDSNTIHITSNVTFNEHIQPPVQLSQIKETSGSTDTPY